MNRWLAVGFNRIQHNIYNFVIGINSHQQQSVRAPRRDVTSLPSTRLTRMVVLWHETRSWMGMASTIENISAQRSSLVIKTTQRTSDWGISCTDRKGFYYFGAGKRFSAHQSPCALSIRWQVFTNTRLPKLVYEYTPESCWGDASDRESCRGGLMQPSRHPVHVQPLWSLLRVHWLNQWHAYINSYLQSNLCVCVGGDMLVSVEV